MSYEQFILKKCKLNLKQKTEKKTTKSLKQEIEYGQAIKKQELKSASTKSMPKPQARLI